MERERGERERVIFGAWQGAYFARMDKLGSAQLEQALNRKRPPAKQQTDEQIGAALFGWLKASEAINERSARH